MKEEDNNPIQSNQDEIQINNDNINHPEENYNQPLINNQIIENNEIRIIPPYMNDINNEQDLPHNRNNIRQNIRRNHNLYNNSSLVNTEVYKNSLKNYEMAIGHRSNNARHNSIESCCCIKYRSCVVILLVLIISFALSFLLAFLVDNMS